MKYVIKSGWNGLVFCLLVTINYISPVFAAPLAYIANYDNKTVSVIDLTTNSVTGSPIPVGTHPSSVAVHPDGSLVYVTNVDDKTVSVISTATNTVVNIIPVGSSPRGIAIHPAGTFVYVSNNSSSNVSVIDTYDNTVVQTIKIGDSTSVGPRGIVVNPAGTRVYVANTLNNTVSVIDTATNSIVGSIAVQGSPFGVATNPTGSKLYVTNMSSGRVTVIDTATNAISAVIGDASTAEATPLGIAIHPSGSFAYVASYQFDCVSIIDTATNTIIGNPIDVGTSPIAVAFNPSGSLLYVTNNGSNTVSVINTTNNTVIKTIAVGGHPTALGQFIGPDVVNGVCGSDNLKTLSTPPANLCASGSPSSTTAGTTTFTWSCSGNGVGTSATCSASRLYEVATSVSGSNGIIEPGEFVAYNGSPTFILTPDSGYLPGTISGTCGGVLSGYTVITNPVTTNCSVTATFAPATTTPATFSFVAQAGLALHSVATSNSVTVSGIAATTAPITVARGTYSLNGGAYTAGSGSIKNGDTVSVRQVTSSLPGIMTATSVTIGGARGDFWVTTASTGCQVSPVFNADSGAYFTSIQEAYDHAVTNQHLKILAVAYGEDVVLADHKTVTLRGGFDCAYATNTSQFAKVRTLTIGGTSGQVVIDNMIIGATSDIATTSAPTMLSGMITVPNGVAITPASLVISSASGDIIPGSNGSFQIAEPADGTGIVTLVALDAAGKLVMLGHGDLDHPELTGINVTTTAMELLFMSTMSFILPQEQWSRVYEVLAAAPETATLASEITARMTVNPTAVADEDTAIMDALLAATTSLMTEIRTNTKVVQQSLNYPIAPDKTMLSADGNNTVSVNVMTQNPYGLAVQASLDDLGIYIENQCRIHRRYYVYRTGYIPSTGNYTDPPTALPDWQFVAADYIPATTGVTGVISSLVDYISGKVAWAPKMSGTIPTPVDPADAKANLFKVYVVGMGSVDGGNPPSDLANHPAALAELSQAATEMQLIEVFKEFIWPIVTKLIPGTMKFADPSFSLSCAQQLVAEMGKFNLDITVSLKKGEVKAIVADFVKLVTSNKQFKDELYEMVKGWLQNFDKTNAAAWKTSLDVFCKCLKIADLFVGTSDVYSAAYQIGQSHTFNSWDMKSISITATLKPENAKINHTSHKITYTVRAMGVPGTELPLTYQWYGASRGKFDDGIQSPSSILTTQKSIVTYDAFLPVPTSGTDTILVDIFSTHGVKIKTASTTLRFTEYDANDWTGVWVGKLVSTCGGRDAGNVSVQVNAGVENNVNVIYVLIASTDFAYIVAEYNGTFSGGSAISSDGKITMELSGDGTMSIDWPEACQNGVFTLQYTWVQ